MEDQNGSDATEQREYTSKDAKDLAGMSYRQINDWDSRGILPGDRDGKRDWRRFTPKEIFTLMVCSEIRKQFGVPVESLKYVKDFMLKEDADHFIAAANLMDMLGVPIMLLTDLRTTFVMDSILEFIDLMQHGFLSGDESEGFIFLKVNPIVNRLLSCLKEPINLPMHGKGYEIIHMMNKMVRTLTSEEEEILDIVRNEDFSKLEIKMTDGEIRMFYIEKEKSINDLSKEEVIDLIEQNEYQSIELHRCDGGVKKVTQRIPIIPMARMKSAVSRRRDPD